MSMRRVFGVVLLLVGVFIFVIGMNASNSLTDQVSKVIVGRFTEATIWYMIGGAASAVTGLMLLLYGFRGKRG